MKNKKWIIVVLTSLLITEFTGEKNAETADNSSINLQTTKLATIPEKGYYPDEQGVVFSPDGRQFAYITTKDSKRLNCF
ncbi:MAG: hypothetical protein ABII74_07390 [Elusimicrobiota bacterium]